MDGKSLPTDTLSPASVTWCQRIGSRATRLSEARDDPVVLSAVQQSINRVNENAISHAQHIQKWSILPRDFSVAGGELGMDHNHHIVVVVVVVVVWCDHSRGKPGKVGILKWSGKSWGNLFYSHLTKSG